MYDLEARGGFGDAAPEPTGTATISLTKPHTIPAAVLLGVAAVQGKVLRWQQRLRLGDELNPSRPKMPIAHPMQSAEARHQVSSRSRGAGSVLGGPVGRRCRSAPKMSTNLRGDQAPGPALAAVAPQKRGPKKDAGPLSENMANSSSTSPLLYLVVKFSQLLLLCNEKSAHLIFSPLQHRTIFRHSRHSPPFAARLCAPFETSNIRLDLAGGPSSNLSMRPGP